MTNPISNMRSVGVRPCVQVMRLALPSKLKSNARSCRGLQDIAAGNSGELGLWVSDL